MYNRDIGVGLEVMILFKNGIAAASVLPTPVGAISKTFFPEEILGHASSCAGVGLSKPLLAKAFAKDCSILIRRNLNLLKIRFLLFPNRLIHF